MKVLLVQWLSILLLGATHSAADAQPTQDPASYCKEKEHADESKCVIYLGGQTGFYSRSGNIGNQNTQDSPASSRYIVFLHDAGGPSDVADQLMSMLRSKGYLVRGVDHDLDDKGGPGVDYFYEQDRSAAAAVAEIANAALPSTRKRLEPRLQRIRNPPGFLGVWLFEKQN